MNWREACNGIGLVGPHCPINFLYKPTLPCPNECDNEVRGGHIRIAVVRGRGTTIHFWGILFLQKIVGTRKEPPRRPQNAKPRVVDNDRTLNVKLGSWILIQVCVAKGLQTCNEQKLLTTKLTNDEFVFSISNKGFIKASSYLENIQLSFFI